MAPLQDPPAFEWVGIRTIPIKLIIINASPKVTNAYMRMYCLAGKADPLW